MGCGASGPGDVVTVGFWGGPGGRGYSKGAYIITYTYTILVVS